MQQAWMLIDQASSFIPVVESTSVEWEKKLFQGSDPEVSDLNLYYIQGPDQGLDHVLDWKLASGIPPEVSRQSTACSLWNAACRSEAPILITAIGDVHTQLIFLENLLTQHAAGRAPVLF